MREVYDELGGRRRRNGSTSATQTIYVPRSPFAANETSLAVALPSEAIGSFTNNASRSARGSLRVAVVKHRCCGVSCGYCQGQPKSPALERFSRLGVSSLLQS
jgi:hypothetical protein